MKTYAEIGRIMGLTPQRVQQIERSALRKLRRMLEKHLRAEGYTVAPGGKLTLIG